MAMNKEQLINALTIIMSRTTRQTWMQMWFSSSGKQIKTTGRVQSPKTAKELNEQQMGYQGQTQ